MIPPVARHCGIGPVKNQDGAWPDRSGASNLLELRGFHPRSV
jgi:hypothetical protein